MSTSNLWFLTFTFVCVSLDVYQRQQDRNQGEEDTSGHRQEAKDAIHRTREAEATRVREEEANVIKRHARVTLLFSDVVAGRHNKCWGHSSAERGG